MAYKFQKGAAILSGNLTQEGAVSVQNDSATTVVSLSKAGAVSGASGVSAASLTVNGSAIITQAKALGNVTTISGASSLSGAKLTINGSDVLSQTKALQNVISISGAGVIQGAKLTINNSDVISQAKALANVISVSASGRLQGDNFMAGGGAANITAAGIVSGAQLQSKGKLTVYGAGEFRGTDQNFPNVAAAALDAADLFVSLDSTTKNMQLRTRTNVVSDMAGAGLTATNGVLSTQAGTATTASTNTTLSEGYNYFGNIAGVTVCSLPSGSKGDVVWVKAATGVTQTNYIIISSSQKDAIDGNTVSASCPRIESPYGAVGFVYVGLSDWRIL